MLQIQIKAAHNGQYHVKMETIAIKILKEQKDAEDAVQNAYVQIIRHYEKISEISCEDLPLRRDSIHDRSWVGRLNAKTAAGYHSAGISEADSHGKLASELKNSIGPKAVNGNSVLHRFRDRKAFLYWKSTPDKKSADRQTLPIRCRYQMNNSHSFRTEHTFLRAKAAADTIAALTFLAL